MDIQSYSLNLAALLRFIITGKKSERDAALDALRAIKGDSTASRAFSAFCEEVGINVMSNAQYSVLVAFPASPDAPLAFNADEIRKLAVGGEKADLTGFATLCVLATFYPSRSALNKGVRPEVTVDNVLGMIDRMVAFADERRAEYQDKVEDVVILADRFRTLSDDVGADSKGKGQKATYVKKALENLVNGGFITKFDGGRYYMPNDSLRILAIERLHSLKTNLGRILSDFIDVTEMAMGDE